MGEVYFSVKWASIYHTDTLEENVSHLPVVDKAFIKFIKFCIIPFNGRILAPSMY